MPPNPAVNTDLARKAAQAPQLHVRPHQMLRSLFFLMLACGMLSSPGANENGLEVQRDLVRIGDEIAQEHCGAKALRSMKQVKNTFDEAIMDQRETIRCNGLVLVIYHATVHKPPLQIHESLTLHGPHAKLPKPITPGATREEVLAYAGKPVQAVPAEIEYVLNDEGPDRQTATFRFSGKRLTSVTWWWSGHQ